MNDAEISKAVREAVVNLNTLCGQACEAKISVTLDVLTLESFGGVDRIEVRAKIAKVL